MGGGLELESRLVRKHKQKLRGPLLLLTRGMTYVTACSFFLFFFGGRVKKNHRRRRRRHRCSSDRFFGRLLSADKAAKMRHGGYGRTTISQRDPARIFRIVFFFLFVFGRHQTDKCEIPSDEQEAIKKNVPSLGAFSPPII